MGHPVGRWHRVNKGPGSSSRFLQIGTHLSPYWTQGLFTHGSYPGCTLTSRRGAGCSQGTGWESHLGKVVEGLCKTKSYCLEVSRGREPWDQIPRSWEQRGLLSLGHWENLLGVHRDPRGSQTTSALLLYRRRPPEYMEQNYLPAPEGFSSERGRWPQRSGHIGT